MTTPNAIDLAGSVSATKAAELKQQGILAVGRYLGPSTSWKAMQLAEVQAILNAGLKIISIFETSPNHSSYFTTLEAKQDAKNAAIYAQAIKQPSGTVIFFTVDYDAPNADLPTISTYFNTLIASSKDYEVGAYGDYQVIEYLKAHTKVKHFMQTIAWSGGKVDESADIYQYQDDTSLVGLSVDLNQLRAEIIAWDLPVETISVTMPTALESAPTETKTTVEVKTSVETVWVDYTVKSGDTVSQLAVDHNTTVTAIESKNGINSKTDLIYVGQVIKVPEQRAVQPSAPAQTETHVDWISHTIKSGEVLGDFAVNGVNADDIAKKNGIDDPDRIYAGQEIKIPKIVNGPERVYYTVKSGDNLSKIAADNNLSLTKIEVFNQQLKDHYAVIQPGEKIRVK